MNKRILFFLLLCLALVGCAKKKDKLDPEPKTEDRKDVIYIVTSRSGDSFEFINPHYEPHENKKVIFKVFKGGTAETIPLWADLSGIKQLDVLEIVDKAVVQKKVNEALRPTTNPASQKERFNNISHIMNENPEGFQVRVLYDDEEELKGIIPTEDFASAYIIGETKHYNQKGETRIYMNNLVSIKRK